MSREGPRSRGGKSAQDTPVLARTSPLNPPPSESNNKGDDDEDPDFNHRASARDRYRVPRSEFYDDEEGDTILHGVVTKVQRGRNWI